MNVISLRQYAYDQQSPGLAQGNQRDQLEAVAQQFEAIFLQQILKQMRKAGDVFKSDDSMRSREMDTMYGYYDQVLVDALAQKRQLGIADMLVRQLGGGDAEPVGGELEPRQSWSSEQAPTSREATAFTALVESVIQQESAGNPAAVSEKGALGLMQLMPATAREMAAELGLSFDESRLTKDADYNRRLGTAYLEKMLQRYDGHPALALAAYNAGPGSVDAWLVRNGDPRAGHVGTDTWVDRIPYRETRLYTRRILEDVQQSIVAEAVVAAEASSAKDAAMTVELPLPFGRVESPSAPVQEHRAERRVELPDPWGPPPLNSRNESVALSNEAPKAVTPHASKAFAQPVRLDRKDRF